MRVIDLVNKMNSKADEIAQLELDLKKLRINTATSSVMGIMSSAAGRLIPGTNNSWEEGIENDTRAIVKIAWAHLQKLRSEYTLMGAVILEGFNHE